MADTLDVLTLAEAKTAINWTGGNGSDTEIALYSTAVSRRIDHLCGPVVVRTITNEQHPGGGILIAPREHPILSVTSVKEFSGATAVTLTAEDIVAGTITGTDYWFDPSLSLIYRRASGYPMCFAATRVVLTYEAGRYEDTEHVDARFKNAAGAALRRLWKRESGAWAQSPQPFTTADTAGSERFFRAIDPVVTELLAYDLRMPATA